MNDDKVSKRYLLKIELLEQIETSLDPMYFMANPRILLSLTKNNKTEDLKTYYATDPDKMVENVLIFDFIKWAMGYYYE